MAMKLPLTGPRVYHIGTPIGQIVETGMVSTIYQLLGPDRVTPGGFVVYRDEFSGEPRVQYASSPETAIRWAETPNW